MCGIWASVGFEPQSSAIDNVSHRGPDGEGKARFDSPQGPVVFLHRRLAIYDLDARSQQPWSLPDGRTVVFNGAIYNYRSIRQELERHGWVFRTDGDTEVLLSAFAHWGPEALHRFNGMFAFAVYDAKRQSLFAARDRFGVKPLYLWAGSAGPGRPGFALASEIKQLLTVPGFTARLNSDALHDFLLFGTTDHGAATCFADIVSLPAGHSITIDLAQPLSGSSAAIIPQRWYNLPLADTHPLSPDDAAIALSAGLDEAVALQTQADVAVGSCLSGGLDSSSIVGMIARRGAIAAQHCVSAVYPGDRVDEEKFINAVGEKWRNIKIHQVLPDPDMLAASLDKIVWHQDEPFGSSSIFAQHCVFEGARTQGLKVMLDGQGADEIFGGYHPMIGAHLADLLRTGRLGRAYSDARSVERAAGLSLKRQALWLASALAPSRVTSLARGYTGGLAMQNWLNESSGRFCVPLTGGNGPARGMDELSRRMIMSTSLPMLLRYEDRNSMASGIEARVPFLDHRIVELAMRLGGRYNIRDGQSKWIARRAFAEVLPKAVSARRDKIGFATPETAWLRGPLLGLARSGITMALESFRPSLNADRVVADTTDMLAGTRDMDGALWRLVCAGTWAKVFGVRLG